MGDRGIVGFVVLGTMGTAMVANQARAGFPFAVWNPTPGRAWLLVALGAVEVRRPREVARADVVVTCVTTHGSGRSLVQSDSPPRRCSSTVPSHEMCHLPLE
jgi:3-hydroxyisobutyrate dehydrogenase-like beta-hydroxyacid dehydrogenase